MNENKGRSRSKEYNPNHNIWNNNGTWFVHCTVYPTPVTKERIRRSLNTKNVEEARQQRDALLRRLKIADRLTCPSVARLAA